MYPVSPDELWDAVVSFLKKRRFRFEEFDKSDRVIVTRWTEVP